MTMATPVVESATDQQQDMEPPYHVVLLNDDYHTMEFVVYLLQTIFAHDLETAARIMLNIHEQGRGIATTCSKTDAKAYLTAIRGLPEGTKGPLDAIMEPAA